MLVVLAVAMAACGTDEVANQGCEDGCEGCEGSCGSCSQGSCAPVPPVPWRGPVLFWSGPPEEAPSCPESAPLTVYEGYAGLTAALECPSCSCGPSACLWPEALLAGESCTPGEPAFPYAIPPGWDGSCTSPGILDGASYSWLLFPALPQAPCAPVEGPTAQAHFSWATLGRACQAPGCPGEAHCGSARELSDGFSLCIYEMGEQECPADYPARTVLHGGVDESGLSCSPCTCGPPEDGFCLGFIRTYQDTECTTLNTGLLVGSHGTACSDMPDALDVGSMAAFWYTQEPGSCASSRGEPIGEAQPTEPTTFCCRTERE
jgi:hypothetical protein